MLRLTNQKSNVNAFKSFVKVLDLQVRTPQQKKNRDNILLRDQGNQQLLKYLNINFKSECLKIC